MIIHMTEKEYDREFRKHDTNFAVGLAMMFSSVVMIALFAIVLAICGFTGSEIKNIVDIGVLAIIFGILIAFVSSKQLDGLVRDKINGEIVIDK